MEIRRFGVGQRRPDGPRGTVGVTGGLIYSDARAVISELAFRRRAAIEPHSNPNTTWFIVIEGGGFVGVGDAKARIGAGEAVLWPAGEPHAAWTEHSEMRAIVVELAGADDGSLRGIVNGAVGSLPARTGSDPPVERGEGHLAPPERADRDLDRSSGEPL